MCWNEGDPTAQSKSRLDRDAVERDVEIGARKSVAVDFTGHGGRPAERGIDLLPIDLLRVGCVGERKSEDRKQPSKKPNACVPPVDWTFAPLLPRPLSVGINGNPTMTPLGA